MTSTEKTTWLALAVLTTSLAASGVTPATKVAEYSIIPDRNPFGLVDPPPKPAVVEPSTNKAEEEPPPNVDLTGFFRDGRKGRTVALFLIESKEDGKPKKDSYMWGVGEGDKGMKVLAINESEETVKLSVRGVESTIGFSKPKPAPTPPARGIPGRPNLPVPNARPLPIRPTNNANQAPRRFDNSRRGGFGRPTTTSSAVGGGLPTQAGGGATPNALQNIPPRNLRYGVNPTANNAAETLTPKQQAVAIEVNRLIQQQNGPANIMPPLPPTQYTPPDVLQRIVVPPSPTAPNNNNR